MATIDSNGNDQSHLSRKRAGVRRMVKHNLKTDMTPMVDLGFLLITFFVITAELSKPVTIKLNMPHDGVPMPNKPSNSIAFLLGGNNQLYYYSDEEQDAFKYNRIYPTTFNEEGIGKIISDKQRTLDQTTGERDKLVVLIKPDANAYYNDIIKVLDEMAIHGVTRYAVVKPGEYDKKFLK